MRFTVVGAGAIGRLWGYKLVQQHQVHFWTRNQVQELSISFQPLEAESPSNTTRFPANQQELLQHSDCVLITVKAFQVQQAIHDILPFLTPGTPIVIMHNGMGSQDSALALLPDNPVIYATTAQAAFRPTEQELKHTGLGQTWMGALNDAGTHHEHLAELFDQALAPCQWHADIYNPLWQKLAINCAINPLTAIHQCRNGELAHDKYSEELATICNEVAQVMSAEGYPTSGNELKALADKVIKATSNNFSSMNQDICQKRTTEIDYITGYLIARAEAHRIEVPANTRLWQQIKQLEQKYNDQ